MPKAEILFSESPWLILLCILAGGIYAFLLYTKDSPWSKSINVFLAILRFLVAGFICFLLLGPFMKMTKNKVEKPSYVIIIDNSQSITQAMDSLAVRDALSKIQLALSENIDEQFEIINLEGNPVETLDSLKFDLDRSNLHKVLKEVQNNYENKNLATAILLSDGIFNQGMSPAYSNYGFSINTIGLGDTIPKKDINLQATYYNKVAYQGNQFSVLAEISSQGFKGKNIEVTISEKGKVIARKSLGLNGDNLLNEVEFLLDANQAGIKHFTVSVQADETEFTQVNNQRDIYLEIIKGKKNILLISPAPHPDIKAIRSALSTNKNYAFTQYIPGLNEPRIASDLLFDLVIYHHIPNRKRFNYELVKRHIAPSTSSLFILGSDSDLRAFNDINQVIKINQRNSNSDAVTPAINNAFTKFPLDEETFGIMNNFPSVNTPFGDYKLQANSEVLLYQRFGSVITDKPLIAVRQLETNKTGIITGDGIWQWRLQNFARNEDHVVFDDFITKLIQYLSSNEKKERFKTYPTNQSFEENEELSIETELYNSLFEPIYNQKIDFTFTNEMGSKNSYSFVNSESGKKFKLRGLKAGVYTYSAKTVLDGKAVLSSGAFAIDKRQLESINLTADHNLLKNLSFKTGGKFYQANELSQAFEEIQNTNAKSIIHSEQQLQPIINLQWLLIILLLLVSIEWFVRKYQGGY